jgi:competence protein ComGC
LGGILGSGELSFFIILVVIILAIISILAIIVIRKRKNEKRKSFNRNNEDVELFDDKPFSADNKKASGMKQ